MNPCPCGYLGDPNRRCRCSPQQIAQYGSRLSGPLRDRIDLTVGVAAVSARDLHTPAGGETSADIRARVLATRARQLARDGRLNSRLEGRALRERTSLDSDARSLVMRAMAKLSLSARAHDRVLRIGRTIADLESSDRVSADHVAEALQFRGEG
jgi:magnesium chelatase family protein